MTRSSATAATPMVQAVDVWKSFGSLDVLKGINLEVQPGEVTLSLIHISEPTRRS